MIDSLRRLIRRTEPNSGLRLYRRFVPRGSLCFDVGANMGGRVALFLELGARVVAVEPQLECAEALRARFPSVEVVEAAAGPSSGTATLNLASYHTLASLAPEWIDAVRASGRFAEFDWSRTVEVPVVTLDELISRFGRPDFCKIDVEGFELGVVQGLTQPVPALSFEFDVEGRETRFDVVRRLAALGIDRFNFSFGESFDLAFDRWLDRDEIVTFLSGSAHSVDTFGDVYAVSPSFRG